MRNTTKVTIALSAGVATMVCGMAAAYADSGSSVTSYSSSSSTTKVTNTAVASSDVAGKVNLRFQVSTGYKTSASCVKVNYPSQRRGHTCVILMKKYYHFQNSGVSRYGHRYYFDDYIGSKYSPVGSKFYYDSHYHTWRKSNCGNFVKFTSVRPALKVASVALVKSFSSVKVTAKVTATATITAYASAWAKTENCYASATASAKGTGTAYAYATAYAMTTAQASAKAAASIRSQVIANAVANAKVSASSSATASASAKAVCTSPTSPPPPPPPSHFVQVSCVYPAHILVGTSDYGYCVAKDDNDALISLQAVSQDTNSHVSGIVSSDQYNGQPCSSGSQCFRFTIWGDNVGNTTVNTTATANGVSAAFTGTFPIQPDQGF